jgi:hypothetical protein
MIKILSLKPFERKKTYEPNYIAEVEFDKSHLTCEIYTNARLSLWTPSRDGQEPKLFAWDHNLSRMNGNLYLRAESTKRFEVVNNRQLSKEIRDFINDQTYT